MDILKVILGKAKIIWYLLMRYFCVTWAWLSKVISIRIQRMKQAGTDRKMEKAFRELGKTVFQLYQEGQQNLLESSEIQEQLSRIQQQLGKKNMLDDRIREIEEAYKQKVAGAKEKYERRKAGSAASPAEEPEEPGAETETPEGESEESSEARG